MRNISVIALKKKNDNIRARDKLSLRALPFFYPTIESFDFLKRQTLLKEERVRTTLRFHSLLTTAWVSVFVFYNFW